MDLNDGESSRSSSEERLDDYDPAGVGGDREPPAPISEEEVAASAAAAEAEEDPDVEGGVAYDTADGVKLPPRREVPPHCAVYDFRGGRVPDGVEVVGDHVLDTQEDGSTILLLGQFGHLRVRLPDGFSGNQRGSRINSYTLTMDVRVAEIPEDGISLFQTAFPDYHDTDEAVLSAIGTVGAFSEFGDTPLFKPGKWNRVVVTLGGNFEIGQHKQRKLTTYVNGRRCVEIAEPIWGYDKDTRFSVNPRGFMMFVSSDHRRMPGGIEIKYLRFSSACDSPDRVREENRVDSVFSQYAASIAQSGAQIRRSLSLAPLMKQPYPIWLDGAFLSAFGDAYLEGTGLGGAGYFQVLTVVHHTLARMVREQAAWLTQQLLPSHFGALERTLATIERSLPLMRRYILAQRGAAQLVAFLKFKEKVLATMKDGESVYMPGGFTHPKLGTNEMLFELTRVDAAHWDMVVVNEGPQGLNFHPCDSFAPKIKYKTAIRLPRIDAQRVQDDGWWVHALSIKLFPGRTTSAASLYDHLLPFLTEGTWSHVADLAAKDPRVPFRTLPRGGSVIYRLFIDAMYASWLHDGVPVGVGKFVLFNLRRQFVKMIVHDLAVVKSITDSDRVILKIAGDQLARRAIRLSSDFNMPVELLRHTRDDCIELERLVASKPSAASENTTPPPTLSLDTTADARTQFYAYPAMERLLRKEDTDGLVGPRVPIPKFVPIDFLQIPQRVTTFEGALTALRYADRLCTLISVQAHCVKNSRFLKCAVLQTVFTQVVPVPAGPASGRPCVWEGTPMRYGVQLDVMILLQRLVEHFVSSALSLQTTRSFDAVRIVVTGAMVAIADCVMRKTATDHPSEVCVTLAKGSFGVGMGMFASQSETIEVADPEINIARTAIMDYFSRARHKHQFFSWERTMAPERTLAAYLGSVCEQLAFPEDLVGYMCDSHHLVIKNYPEFACYRDICFFWKFMMNTEGFPNVAPYSQRDAELQWGFDNMEGVFVVKAFGGMPLPAKASGHRWASGAAPSRYTAPVKIYSEDDLLHIHSFSCFEKSLTQKDIELLLSFLTVPYMRIPLTLNFFATADRINALRDKELRALLDSVVFEPSRYLTIDGNFAPTCVPSEDPALVATPYGLLLNELHRSPRGLIDTLVSLIKQARKLDVGTVYSSTVGVILYVVRLVHRVESAMKMLLQIATNSHASIDTPLRDVALDCDTIATLVDGLSVLEAMLRSGPNSIQAMLETWLMECHRKMAEATENANDVDEDFDNLTGSESDSDGDDVDPEEKKRRRLEKEDKKSGGSSKVDKNTKISCRLYAHLVLMHRNLTLEQLNLRTVSTMLSAFQFLQTRHTWNHLLLEVPETEIYEAMDVQRRNIITWMSTIASHSERNHVLECIVRVTAATGVRIARADDVVRDWDFITGVRSAGRYTLASKAASVIAIHSADEYAAALARFPKVCVDFHASWCGPCHAMSPVVKLMAQQIPGVVFLKVDVDELPDVAAAAGVTAMPTFKIFHAGSCRATVVGADPGALREHVQAVNNIITSSEGTCPDHPNLIADAVGAGGGVDPDEIKEEEINLQTFVLQLKSNHLKALDDTVQANFDVQTVFQTQISMQCAVLETAQNREWFRLIGRFHDIQWWRTPDQQVALQVNDREYDPGSLGRFEGFIVPLFEPVRLTYFNDPMNPIEFVMPEHELPPGSSVGYVVALHPKRGGTWKEVFVFQEYGVVHVYDVVSYGRRHYRMLSYTTDTRFTLHEMQPSTADRQSPWPTWCRHGAGDPTKDLDPGISAVIIREMQAKGNISGTHEQFIPRRFLYGLVPSALVDTHLFWQDESDNIIGYPVDENAAHHLYITFSEKRPHQDIPCMPSDCLAQIRRVPTTVKAAEALPSRGSTTPPPPAGAAAAASATTAVGVEPEVQLVNLMFAKRGSALHSIAKVLARIENLSHILVWTRDIIAPDSPPPHDVRIHSIELPRLKLTFAPRRGADGVERLFSVDHVDLFITNERNPLVCHLIRGIPHSLILSTINGENTVLVPSISPVRPFIQSSPFSSELVLDRANAKWRDALASPYYLYPVHISMSFLQTPTLSCALYLLLLRLSFRAYEDVVRLVDTIATDTDFKEQPEELQIFKALGRLHHDCHPNSHAARLKVNVVMADSPVTAPWMLDVEVCKLVNKLAHISSACQLSIHERILLLDECEALEKKQEIIAAVVEEYGAEEVVALLGQVLDPEAAIEVQFAEKKKIDRFFKSIQDKIYAALRRRVREEEIIDIIKRVLKGFQLPELFVCLWKNAQAYITSFTTGAPVADVRLPRPARESAWRTVHLPHVYGASEGSWSLLSINDVQSRAISGHMLIDVLGALYSGRSDTLGGRTGFSFLFFYGLFTGSVKFRFGNCKDAHTFATLALPLLADYGDNLLSSILHVLSLNPLVCAKVPQFKDTRKMKDGPITASIAEGDHTSPLDDLLSGVVSYLQRSASRLNRPVDAHAFNKFPSQRETQAVPSRDAFRMEGSTNFPFGEYRLPIDSCGYNPVLYNTAKERLYLPQTPDMEAFATFPLQPAGFDHYVIRARNETRVKEELPFDVSEHRNASSHIAIKMLERFSDEMRQFAHQHNENEVPRVVGLEDEHTIDITLRNTEPLIVKLTELHENLTRLRDADSNVVQQLIGDLAQIANAVPDLPDDAPADASTAAHVAAEARRRFVFQLRRRCGLESFTWVEYLVGALISDVGDLEYTKLNPFLDHNACIRVRDETVRLLLYANRVGHANRALQELRDLVRLLRGDCSSEKQRASLLQKADALAAMVSVKRHYIEVDPANGRRYLDPRFLVFEFTWNLVLRESQVIMVRCFMDELNHGRSSVWQLIMGAGKTTVVGPLLALLLTTGKQLVMQVVPPALLEFSRGVMRSTFSSIIKKRVYTFLYDRSTEVDPMLYRKLLNAQCTAGVVVTNPTSIKSLQLKFIEYLDMIADSTRPRTAELEESAAELGKVLGLFRTGVLMMDEVDLILHPLKSELNFPIGAKEPLDFSPLRWQMPIHLLDAIFFANRGKMAVEFRESVLAAKILRNVQKVITTGYMSKALQANPHIVLLDAEFYHNHMKPLLAQWLLLWMEQHSFTGIGAEDTLAYITTNNLHDEALKVRVNAGVQHRNKQMLNLAHDWLNSYLPHALMKIDRVTFGIMTKADSKRALRLTPNMPRSRMMLAIPFVGKDVPSDASEFAHPDIIIGLTILAYRYEGLRFSDFKEIVSSLRETVLKEHGPWHERKTNVRYEQWVKEAGGTVRGQVDYRSMTSIVGAGSSEALDGLMTAAAATSGARRRAQNSADNSVISLKLLKQSSREQLWELFVLLRKLPDAIHWYLNEFVFPTHMRFQNVKISASGQDLGGDMLFPRRVGFSGTPSDLLPVELGRCHYEAGSDGLVISTLTNPAIVTFDIVEAGWSPHSLLRTIATENRYHALIDTGALITGMSNLDVARFLLDAGLSGKEGVVFLDESDRKMILVRATGRVLKLEECGIPLEKRFAFYDQVHTTGMDIRHTPNALAALTVGKDMTFRDYAQGAFRMRGINKGQRIHLLITPELRELMLRELRAAKLSPVEPPQHSSLLVEVTSWLVINSMGSERLQFNQLCLQNVTNVYRKNGFANLLKGHRRFKISEDMRADHCLGPSLAMFHEPVEFNLEACVPEPRLFSETIEALIADKRGTFIASKDELAVVLDVHSKVVGLVESTQERAFNQDMVREQEEEKEKMKEVVEEKELEITQFKDQQYARDQEEPTPWLFMALSNRSDISDADPPTFYDADQFRLFARQPIRFPKNIQISSNYFDRRWSGHRRVKNVIMALDWIPDRELLRPSATPLACAPHEHNLNRTLQLLVESETGHDASGAGVAEIRKGALRQLFSTAFETPLEPAAVDALVSSITRAQSLSFREVEDVMAGPALRREDDGRIAVCLSLIEAETIRRIMHVKHGEDLIEGSRTDLCLRAVCCENYLMDRSAQYQPPPTYQRDVTWQALRFLDCETHLKDAQLNFLLKAVQLNAVFERRLFFEQIIGCKRRNQKNWEKTPISRAFSIESEYALLHLRMLALRVKELVKRKELLPFDAFQKFDHGRLGSLSAANIFAAFRWLGLHPTHEDVLDYVAMANVRGEGRVNYSEWLEMMRDATISAAGGGGTSADPDGGESLGGGGGGGGMGERASSSLEFLAMDSPSTQVGQQSRFAGVIEDRIPPLDESTFEAIAAQRNAHREELKRQTEERMKHEQRKFATLMRQYKKDVRKARGTDDNPSVVAGVLRFDFSQGFAPDDVTMTGYTYFEPALDGKKQLHADVESMVVLPLGAYGLDGWPDVLNEYSVTMSVTMTCDDFAGPGVPLLQLVRHLPGGLIVSVLHDGTVGVADLKRESIFVDERGQWQWESNDGWLDFDREYQPMLESAYRRDPHGSCSLVVFDVGVIVVNFRTMTQRNSTTGGERPVRRQQETDGKRVRPHQLALVTVNVNVDARTISCFVDGAMSTLQLVPPEIPLSAFQLDMEHQIFLFGHADKHVIRGGSVKWVSLQPRCVTDFEVSMMFEQHRLMSDWQCRCCTYINKESSTTCEVCGGPR